MLAKSILRRCFSNLRTFDSLQNFNTFLSTNKPCQHVVYFRAAWNPQCEQADKHAEKLAASNGGLQVYKIDTDVSPKIANHYRVKAEPEFVFCLYGDQVIRQIGLDYNGLVEKTNRMDKLSQTQDFHLLENKWVEYGHAYKSYYARRLNHMYRRQVNSF